MRLNRVVAALITLSCASAARSEAQTTIAVVDHRAPRASMKVGYGGHGLDWETSVDSPLLADRIRLRAGVGHGRWDSEFDSLVDPRVTRLAASAIVFIRQPYDLKPYVGLGIARLIPRGLDMQAQMGTRVILGAEVPGERWTIGVEVELDVPHQPEVGQPVRDELFPVGRLGLVIRRAF